MIVRQISVLEFGFSTCNKAFDKRSFADRVRNNSTIVLSW